MSLVRRPLAPGETDHELIWLCVSFAAFGLAASWFMVGLPWPHCIFLAITGHPCLTCGATRCAIAFFRFNPAAALKWNPLVFSFLFGLSLFDAYAFVAVLLRTRRLRIRLSTNEKKFLRAAVILLLLANWIYLLSRPRDLF